MTKKVKLEAWSRSKDNGKASDIRLKKYLPAVIYGPDMENQNIKVKKYDFEQVYDAAGESNLVDLTIDGADPIKVVVKDIQKESVRGTIIHADLYKVDMKKQITIEVPLKFIGEALAEKEQDGTLVTNMSEVEAKCLPGDLVEYIEVDLSPLKTFDDVIRVGDLNIPRELEVLADKQDMIASVLAPRVEEEPVAEEDGEEAAEEDEKSEEENKGEKKEDGGKEGKKEEKKGEKK